jgi:hypothetical protein
MCPEAPSLSFGKNLLLNHLNDLNDLNHRRDGPYVPGRAGDCLAARCLRRISAWSWLAQAFRLLNAGGRSFWSEALHAYARFGYELVVRSIAPLVMHVGGSKRCRYIAAYRTARVSRSARSRCLSWNILERSGRKRSVTGGTDRKPTAPESLVFGLIR